MLLSVTIITLNEEKNLARALDSVAFADEVIVVDSGSTDKTQKIAEEKGAKLIINPFLGYGQQKNFAASKCQGKWILNIDADEEVTKSGAEEILATIKNPASQEDLFFVARKTFYSGKWVRHGGWFPNYVARLATKENSYWSEPEVHEELLVKQGKHRKLQTPLNHFSFPNIKSQAITNCKYAHHGAKNLVIKNKATSFFHLLFKPPVKFIECYLLKAGFLDGWRGFVIAVNAAHSIFLKYAIAHYNLRTQGD